MPQRLIPAAWFMFIAIACPCRAQVTTNPEREQSVRLEAWRTSMTHTPLPKHGCFNAAYPSGEWTEVTCVTASPSNGSPVGAKASGRVSRPESSVTGVGGGYDFAARSPGLITWAAGSFPSVTGITSEVDIGLGVNTFTLQLNTNNDIPTTLCPGCGWQQFIFANYPEQQQPTAVFMQYWLLDTASCPPFWTVFQGGGGESPGCYVNSPMTPVSPVTIADLGSLSLFAQASGGTDVVIVFTPNGHASAEAQDSVLDLQYHWNTAEFNVFGAAQEALFDSGTTIVVQTSIYDGTGTPPTCIGGGFTAETNNLTLVPIQAPICLPAVINTSAQSSVDKLGNVPSINFMESNTGSVFNPGSVAAPIVDTGAASSVTSSTAQLSGSVNPNGSETLVWYEYSAISSALNCYSPPTLTQPMQFVAGSGTAPVGFSAALGGLNRGTTYYFVACALYPGGLVEGRVGSFIATPPSPPSLNGPSASAITSSTATLSDTVNPNGLDTHVWFQYSTSSSFGCSLPTLTPALDVGAGTAYVTSSAKIIGLSSNTRYYIEACASNAGGEVANATGSFTTPSTTPAVNITSLGNAASFTQSFAPGMLMSVFGTNLSSGAPQTVVATPLPLTSASGTSISINGIAAPLLYISAMQINLQIPYGVAVGNATLTVNSGGKTASINFSIQAAGPGIFVDSSNGLVVPNETAAAGAIIGLFVTGAGQVTPSEATGNVPPAGLTPVPNLPVAMTVGGVAVTKTYVGIPNWSVGTLQINFVVPPTLAAGSHPVVVTIGGVSSQPALLTVTK
jgi:uncharacterized protein (TIGR03437 family)